MNCFVTKKWPNIILGIGSSVEVVQRFRELNANRILVLYSKSVWNTGLVQPIIEQLEKANFSVWCYEGAKPDVPDYTVEEVATLARENKIDGFLAIGGGSVMDTAKNAAVYKFCAKPLNYYFENPFSEKILEEKRVKLICIPTTAGTGAEMTGGGPVCDGRTGKKERLHFPESFADWAILDANFTTSLPPYLTAITAMDALAHAIEGMTGKTRNPKAEMFCGQAIAYIQRSLPKAWQDGTDLKAREELLLAANLAIGVETQRHLGHAIAHGIGGTLHLAHGHACALVLPPMLRYLDKIDEIQDALCIIAKQMGVDIKEDAAHVGYKIAAVIEGWNEAYGIQKLKALGYQKDAVMDCLPFCMEDKTNLNNMIVSVSTIEVEKLLLELYE